MIFLRFILLLVCVSAWAANPSFSDFNGTQFGTSGNKVSIASGAPITNAVLVNPSISGQTNFASLNGTNTFSGTNTFQGNTIASNVSVLGTLTQSGTAVTLQSRTITVAGTANEITSSAGSQDLSANRTWTMSLPSALTFLSKVITGGTYTNGIFDGATLGPNLTNLTVGANSVYVNSSAGVATGVPTIGVGSVMRTRTGVNRSLTIPMGAWFTNGIASPATPLSYTNSGDSFGFADGSTNTIRLRCPIPLQWNAGTVYLQLTTGTILTNQTSSTNVVWSVKGGSITNGQSETQVITGSAAFATNHVNKSQFVSSAIVSSPITVGNSSIGGQDVMFELTRMTSDATDTMTNTVYAISSVLYYTEQAIEASIPATTN